MICDICGKEIKQGDEYFVFYKRVLGEQGSRSYHDMCVKCMGFRSVTGKINVGGGIRRK